MALGLGLALEEAMGERVAVAVPLVVAVEEVVTEAVAVEVSVRE